MNKKLLYLLLVALSFAACRNISQIERTTDIQREKWVDSSVLERYYTTHTSNDTVFVMDSVFCFKYIRHHDTIIKIDTVIIKDRIIEKHEKSMGNVPLLIAAVIVLLLLLRNIFK